MSEGVVNVEAGGKTAEFNARCRVIACANTTEGFSSELLDRFDFRFDLENPGKEEQKRIVGEKVNCWFREKPDYEGVKLRDFLRWIEPFKPEVPDEVREQAKEMIRDWIDSEGERTSIRQKESIMRIAYTIAKLNRRDMEIGDVSRAIDLQVSDFGKNRTLKGSNHGENLMSFSKIP